VRNWKIFHMGKERLFVKAMEYKGGTYFGEKLENIPHGEGTFIRKGHVFHGNFVNGKKDGYGTLKILEKNGELDYIYCGNWSENKKHGEGTIISFDNQQNLSYVHVRIYNKNKMIKVVNSYFIFGNVVKIFKGTEKDFTTWLKETFKMKYFDTRKT